MRTKFTPPEWKDIEEFEEAYKEGQKNLRAITICGALLCTLCHVTNTFLLPPHPLYWVFWGVGTGGLLLAVVSLFFSLVLKHDHPGMRAWYEENQGDDAVTITDSE